MKVSDKGLALIKEFEGCKLTAHQDSEAQWKDIDGVRHCTIRLRDYPHGLGHEADHCFRGMGHGDVPNGDGF